MLADALGKLDRSFEILSEGATIENNIQHNSPEELGLEKFLGLSTISKIVATA